MSAEIQALQALVSKTIADVNAKLASVATEGLSPADQATVASISAALEALDQSMTLATPPAASPTGASS